MPTADTNSTRDASKVTVVVGFGGSGGKILREFSRLVATDSEWGSRAAEQIFMMLCDTDVDDLAKSARSVDAAFGSAVHRPHLEVVELASGLGGDFQTAVEMQWSRHSDGARQRMSQKWWTLDGMPFSARHLPLDPIEGAGQCPMVSYYLAWAKGPEIRRRVDALVDEINARIPHGGKPPRVEVTIMGSLAGGTGRGCWSLLAFMLRRALEAKGLVPKPMLGLFLDQGCFSEVQRDRPEQAYRMRLNSLTGLSEVVLWTRVAASPKEQESLPSYWLPSLVDPENPDLDTIPAHTTGSPPLSHSPIDYAQIVFASSKSGTLSDPRSYYTILASALYARLSISEIQSTEQNSFPRLGSLGGTRIEVPYIKIADYIRTHAVLSICEEAEVVRHGEGIPTAAGLLGCLDTELEGSGPRDGVEWVIDAVRSRISQKADDAIEEFRRHMDHDDQLNGRNEIQLFGNGNAGIAKAELRAVLTDARSPFEGYLGSRSELDSAWLRNSLLSSIEALLRGGISRLRTAEALVNDLAESLVKAKRRLKSWAAADGETHSVESLGELFDKLSKRELLTPWVRFTEAEKRELSDAAKALWERESIRHLVDHICGAIDEATTGLEVVRRNLKQLFAECISTEMASRRVATANARRGLFLQKTGEKGREAWEIERCFGDPFDSTRYVYRQLRPRLDEKAVSDQIDLLLKEARPAALMRDLAREVAGLAVGPLLTPDRFVEIRESSDRRFAAIEHSIHVPISWMADHYSFDKVIEGHRLPWIEELTANSGHVRAGLMRRFKSFYGVEAIENSRGVEVPSTAAMLESLAIAVAKSCDPFVQIPDSLAPENAEGDQVCVAIPKVPGYGEDERQKLQTAYKSAGLRTRGWVTEGGNPFVMTAYTMQSLVGEKDVHSDEHLDRVHSMKYHQQVDRDDLAAWLRWSESPDGESVFTERANNIGLGFADPTMVRDARFRDRRWRPWARRDEEAAAAREHQATDAILYALLGNVGTGAPGEVHTAVQHVGDIFQARGLDEWRFPILTWSNRKMRFSRDPVAVHAGTQNSLVTGRSSERNFTLTELVAWMSEDDGDARARVKFLLDEREVLRTAIGPNYGIGASHFAELHKGVECFLVDLQREMNKMGGSHAERFRETVDSLLARHRSMTP